MNVKHMLKFVLKPAFKYSRFFQLFKSEFQSRNLLDKTLHFEVTVCNIFANGCTENSKFLE